VGIKNPMKELFLYRIKQAEKPSKKEKYIRKVMMWIVVDIVSLAFASSLYMQALEPEHYEITRSDVRAEVDQNIPRLTAQDIPPTDGMGVHEEGGETPVNPLAIIKEVFGEQAEAATKIAKCESQLEPTRIGDEHLISKDGEEIIGRSIGIFQIRTGGNDGGKVWNRAKANGMTVAEFEKKMMNPEENIKYAKKIYDRAGFNAWYNCKNKEL